MIDLPAPEHSFASDNAAGASPEVLEALAAANIGSALAYGDDRWTRTAIDDVRRTLDAPAEVLFTWGGTGANVVGLGTLLQPWQAVICADSAHIVVDECGAPVRFTNSQLIPVATPDGKLRPDDLVAPSHWLGSEHHPQPRVVSITQSTEMGTLYTVDEIAALCDAAHALDMVVHLDGARIANAAAALNTDLRAMIRDTGVDAFTFGFTKNGAVFGEAVCFVDPSLAASAAFVRKQAGQLVSKSRFVAAQISALLADDLWLRNARHANDRAQDLAQRVSAIDGVEVCGTAEVNAVFVRLPRPVLEVLREWSFFWEWDAGSDLVRWMTSFATTAEDIDRFVDGIRVALRLPS